MEENEVEIDFYHASQRLDKFLLKRFPNARKSLLYKFLREKRVKRNGARAQGNEILREGDKVKFYLSPETMEALSQPAVGAHIVRPQMEQQDISILYEDENLLVCDKPAGLLTQPDAKGGDSLVTRAILHLGGNGRTLPPAARPSTERADEGCAPTRYT